MRRLLLLLALAAPLHAQTTPQTFRLVTPKGPGGITIDTTGWTIEKVTLYDQGSRAVLFMVNASLGIDVSYILSNDPTFDYNRESCKNDVLAPMVRDVFKNATLKNKSDTTRSLHNGQTLDIGSYLVVKNEGITLNQQNVFGFISHDHTCAEIHLSRTPFKEGEEHIFDPILDSFTFDPNYTPTAADYKAISSLLPPGMASAYGAASQDASSSIDPHNSGQSLTFALPNHPGYLQIDAPNFIITELSAKPNGLEYGIRAKDSTISGAEALGFLFVTNSVKPPVSSAVACRDWMLASEKSGGDRNILKTYEDKSESGVPIALVDYEQTKAPPAFRYVRRFFIASGDLCADISITAANAIMTQSADITKSLTFDPNRPPDFFAKFRYAQVILDHHNPAAAAPIYESALTLVSTVDDSLKWRRIATDQASMSYGMSGNLKKSRALNQAAIAQDPDYPLYYYNLACADAESNDPTAARTHLDQAFARRSNTLPGEHLPDPTTDDSFLKLKSNKPFWTFLQSLPKS